MEPFWSWIANDGITTSVSSSLKRKSAYRPVDKSHSMVISNHETTKLYADVANQASSSIIKPRVRVWFGLGTAVRSLVQWIL